METIRTHKSWLIILLCLTIFSLPLVTLKGAFDAFAYFPGSDTKGETQDETAMKEGAFEVLSFEIGAENTVNIGSISSGSGAGKATFKEMTLTKKVDSSSTDMFSKLTTGQHFEEMVVFLRRSGSDPGKEGLTFLKYEFKLVMIQDISWSGSDGDDIVEETVVFQYGAVKISYTEQEFTGEAGDMHEATWSRVLNTSDFAVE